MVQSGYSPLGVNGDYPVADTAKRDPEVLFAGVDCLLCLFSLNDLRLQLSVCVLQSFLGNERVRQIFRHPVKGPSELTDLILLLHIYSEIQIALGYISGALLESLNRSGYRP